MPSFDHNIKNTGRRPASEVIAVKQFPKKIFAVLRSFNPAVRRRYDVAGEVYSNPHDSDPAFAYAFKGEYKISFRQVLALLMCLGSLVLFRRRK